MEYNYEVKIDDLRRHYESEIAGMVEAYKQNITALNQEQEKQMFQLEKQN